MFHTTPAPVELSLHVVGLAYPNDDKAKSNRQFEARLCVPGETVHLVPEPKNKRDPHAVAVFSQRHIQLGYLTFERCGWVSAKIGEGMPVEAVFQIGGRQHRCNPCADRWRLPYPPRAPARARIKG